MHIAKTSRIVACAAFAVANVSVAAGAAQQKVSSETLAALQTIRRDADSIASGRVRGKQQLDAPAREIAIAWSKAVAELDNDGNVRVEREIANKSITKLESSYKIGDRARTAAKDVSADVGDLIDAASKG